MSPIKPSRRFLSFQTLEKRMLLASLTSRLPPIRLITPEAPASQDQVQIEDHHGRSYVLSQAGLDGILRLQRLDRQLAQTSPSVVTELQEAVWQRVAQWASAAGDSTISAEQAVGIADAGFQVTNDSPLFGPPLSARLHLPASDPLTDAATEPANHGTPILALTDESISHDSQSDVAAAASKIKQTVNAIDLPTIGTRTGSVEAIETQLDQKAALQNARDLPRRRKSTGDLRDQAKTVERIVELRPLPSRGVDGAAPVADRASDPPAVPLSTPAVESRPGLLQEMIWLPVEFGADVFAEPLQAGVEQSQAAMTSPLALLQLFVGGSDTDVEAAGWLRFSPITLSVDQPSDDPAGWSTPPHWSCSALSVLFVSAYWYERRIRVRRRETNQSAFAPLKG